MPNISNGGNGQANESSLDNTTIASECAIDAMDDDYSGTPVDGTTGGTIASVFDNDEYLGEIVDPNDFEITPNTNGPLTVNADGTVDVAPGTPSGNFLYKILFVRTALQ